MTTQGFITKKWVNTYNVDREHFKVWTANSDMKKNPNVCEFKGTNFLYDSCW